MPRLWQYKGQVGPISTVFSQQLGPGPEMWQPSLPDRQLRPPMRATALLLAAATPFVVSPQPLFICGQATEPVAVRVRQAQGLFGPPFPAAPESVSADRWHYPVEQPYPARLRLRTGPDLALDPPPRFEAVSSDRFAYPVEQPYPARSRLRIGPDLTFSVQFVQAAPTSADQWHPNIAQAYPARPLPAREGWSAIDAAGLAAAERPQTDKFLYSIEQPYPARRLPAREGVSIIDGFALTRAEAVSIDRFGYRTEQPYLVLRRPVNEGLFVIDTLQLTRAENPSIDRFGYPIEQPYPSRRLLAREGIFAVDVLALTRAELSFPDKWAFAIEQPTRPLRRVLDVAELLDLFPRPDAVPIDRWLRLIEQPYPYRPKPTAEGLFLADAAAQTRPEATSVDRWHLAANQPPGRILRVLDVQQPFLFAESLELSTITKWRSQYPDLIFGLGRGREPGIWVTDASALTNPESVDLSKFQQPQSVPRRDAQLLRIHVLAPSGQFFASPLPTLLAFDSPMPQGRRIVLIAEQTALIRELAQLPVFGWHQQGQLIIARPSALQTGVAEGGILQAILGSMGGRIIVLPDDRTATASEGRIIIVLPDNRTG